LKRKNARKCIHCGHFDTCSSAKCVNASDIKDGIFVKPVKPLVDNKAINNFVNNSVNEVSGIVNDKSSFVDENPSNPKRRREGELQAVSNRKNVSRKYKNIFQKPNLPIYNNLPNSSSLSKLNQLSQDFNNIPTSSKFQFSGNKNLGENVNNFKFSNSASDVIKSFVKNDWSVGIGSAGVKG